MAADAGTGRNPAGSAVLSGPQAQAQRETRPQTEIMSTTQSHSADIDISQAAALQQRETRKAKQQEGEDDTYEHTSKLLQKGACRADGGHDGIYHDAEYGVGS